MHLLNNSVSIYSLWSPSGCIYSVLYSSFWSVCLCCGGGGQVIIRHDLTDTNRIKQTELTRKLHTLVCEKTGILYAYTHALCTHTHTRTHAHTHTHARTHTHTHLPCASRLSPMMTAADSLSSLNKSYRASSLRDTSSNFLFNAYTCTHAQE